MDSKTFESVTELDIDKISLDELIVALGSTLFAGYDLSEISDELLNRLEELIKAELIIRESGMIYSNISKEIH